MKRILIGLVVLAAGATAWGQGAAKQPAADAEYQQLMKEYTLNPDGSMDYRLVKDLKLITYRAFNSLYGETFVSYNPRHQKLKINEAYTTMAAGKKVIAPKNAFNEVLPSFASNAPAFNALREMVITHTALERNAVIHLDYTIHTDKGFYPAFSGTEILAEQEPVKNLVIRVRVPAGGKLYYGTANQKYEPIKTTEGNFSVFTWNLAEVPAISGEEFQPAATEAYPVIFFSNRDDLSGLVSGILDQPAFKYQVTSPMKAIIPVQMTDKLQAALKIQEKVINEISLVNVPMKLTGYAVRTPEDIWTSNYGTGPEKAVLLATILRAAGVPSTPVAVTRAITFDAKAPVAGIFDDFAVAADCGEAGTVYLSASSLNSQDLRYSLPGRVFVTLNPEKVAVVKPGELPAKAALTANLFISGEEALTGDATLTLSNGSSPLLAVTRDPSKTKNYFGGGIKSSDIKEITRSAPGLEQSVFAVTVQRDHVLRKDTLLRFFTIPFATNGVENWGIRQLTSNRKSLLEVPLPQEETINITLTIPENLVLMTSTEPVEITNKAGTFLFSIALEDGKLMIHKEIHLKSRIITPEIYGDFKALADNWNVGNTRELIWKVK